MYLLKITAGFLFIKDGEITESGTKEKIFSKPEKDYAKKLIEISGIKIFLIFLKFFFDFFKRCDILIRVHKNYLM